MQMIMFDMLIMRFKRRAKSKIYIYKYSSLKGTHQEAFAFYANEKQPALESD